MADETKAFFEKFDKDLAKMKEKLPDAIGGFGIMFGKIMKDGALTIREKELVALGIAVAMQCEPCIKLHIKKCLTAGATKEQILEAASVSIMMAGGPAYTHIPMVLDTLEGLES